MKILDRRTLKILQTLSNNKSSADADKRARRIWRPQKVIKHDTFYMLGTVSY